MIWFSPNYEEEAPPITARGVRRAFRQKWGYNFKVEEYKGRHFDIIIYGRNIPIEAEDLKDLFIRDLMIDKVHVRELK